MAGLDVVLVKPGAQRDLYGELARGTLTGIEPPLWGALAAAWLREKGYGVDLLDAELEGWSPEEAAEQALARSPRLVGVVASGTNPSASTMSMLGAGQLLTALRSRSPRTPLFIMGLHPSALPERTLMEENADFVVQGEGFYTLAPLVEAIKEGVPPAGIPGLWRREGGKAVPAERPPLFADLDALPLPAWDLLDLSRYRAHNWHCFDPRYPRSPYGVLYTNLGCPFRCSFCCINALFGRNTIRYRSPERVIEEIDLLVNRHGVRTIKIIDEMFAINEDRVVRLCDLIIGRGYDLNFWAYARVNTVTERMLRKMKQAGIHWAAYGFESGSDAVLDGVTKGVRPGQLETAVRMTRDAGLSIIGNFMFGLPEDDESTMRQTLELAERIDCEFVNFNCTMAYPGSELYREAVGKGLPLPATWEGFTQYGYESMPLPTRHLTAAQVLAFRDRAFDEYFARPSYLAMLEAKFGPAARRGVEEMLKTPLRRRLLEQAGTSR
jgi:anaerobic magnesium-protoporphyrin IX monomethyl ester cyclase